MVVNLSKRDYATLRMFDGEIRRIDVNWLQKHPSRGAIDVLLPDYSAGHLEIYNLDMPSGIGYWTEWRSIERYRHLELVCECIQGLVKLLT